MEKISFCLGLANLIMVVVGLIKFTLMYKINKEIADRHALLAALQAMIAAILMMK